MRYAAAEKLEIIRLVEQSSLPVRRTLEQLGIPRSTFYRWYERYRAGRAEGLSDRTPAPRRVRTCRPVRGAPVWREFRQVPTPAHRRDRASGADSPPRAHLA